VPHGAPSGAAHFPLAPPDDLPVVVARTLWVLGVRPATDGVRIDAEHLTATFGPWRLSTPLSNVAGAEVGGPYSAWKVIGPRLSLSDRGLTFGTSTSAGVCISFHDPVPGIEPLGLLRHPGLTVTVARPDLLVARLR
jgi:hypothetical protein